MYSARTGRISNVEELGSGPRSGYAPVDPFKASVSLGIRKILGRTNDRTIDEVPVAPPAPHPFQHQPWQRPPTKKDKKQEALEEEEVYYQRQQNYGRAARYPPFPNPSSGRHVHPTKRAKEDEYEEQEAYPDTQKWLRGTPTFTSPPESPWSTVEHLQPSGVYDGVPPPLNLERVAEPRRLSRITERTEDSDRASPSLSSRSTRTPSPRDRQDQGPTAPYRFIHPTSGVQHDVSPLSNPNSQDALSVHRDSEGVPQSSGPAGTEPPKYVGHLWYLNVHAESLPYRWERCQALLYSDRLLLTWTSWGADGKRETLDWTMGLSSCRVISSNPKTAHPGAPEDIGIIAAGEQEAMEINGGKVDLAEYLVPFQLVWPGDTERLAAESLNERSEWVNRIWDVMNGREPATVGNELQTSSPVTSFCYDLSAPPPDRPAAHHRRSSSLSARPVAESQKGWKRWANTMFSTEASNKDPFVATTESLEDSRSEGRRSEYIEESMLAIAMSLFLDVIPRQLYLYFLLHFPALYFSRVTRIFHDANLGMSEIKKMALDAVESGGRANKMLVYNGIFPQEDNDAPAEYVNLRTSWYSFVDSLMREWKTLNIISVLLLSAILTILQIDVAAANPLTRYTALTSLLCAFMSLIYGCIYIIRFGTMRKAYKAAEWANESERSATSIFWNVWVMLAMPAVWLGWSMIFFIVCITSFIWQTGPTVSPSTDPPIYLPSDPQILIPRIVLSLLLGLGSLYLILIAVTFRKYGDPMEEAWRERIRGWMQERAARANPFSRQDYSTSKDNLREKVYDLKGDREDGWADAFASQGRPTHPMSRWESKSVPKVDPGSFTDLPELERPDNPTNDGFPQTSASVPVPVPIPRSGFPTPASPVTRPVGGGVNALAPFTNFMSANLPNLLPLSARGDRKKEMKEKKVSMANASASSPLFTSFSPRHTSSPPIPTLAPLPTESMTVNDGYPIVPGVVAIPFKGRAPPDDSTPQVGDEIEDMKEIIRLDSEGLHVRDRPAAEGIPMPEDLLEAGLQAESWPLLCEDINRDWGTVVLSRPNSLRDLLKSLKKWNSKLTAHNMFLLLVQLDSETLPPLPSSRSPEVLMSSVVQNGCAVYLGSSDSKNARVRRGSGEDEVIETAGDGDIELYKPMWYYALIEPPVEAVVLEGNGGTGLSEDAKDEGLRAK